jgi:hypothetical protein
MGLILNVYGHPRGDFTNGGLSAKHDEVTVVNVDGPFEPTEDRPAVMLVNHVRDIVSLVPAKKDENGAWVPDRPDGLVGPMMGGNYATTSDSRFASAIEKLVGHRFYGAVAVHDRFETPEQYDRLSR